MFYLWAALSKSLTPAQICDLPPGTISDIVNEHNLTVHWTEKHAHRDCALYTGEENRPPLNFPCTDPPAHAVAILQQVDARAGVETPPRIRSSSGTVPIDGST